MHTAAWLERGTHANTKPGVRLVFHPFLCTLTFHSTAACHLASYLITVWAQTVNIEYTVVWVCISESPATAMALTSNQPHCIPSLCPENRESERGAMENSTCQQNNGRLPLSHGDTPECLMVKLIMSSLGWTGEPPRTPRHHWGPWNCTWHSHSQVWHGVCWGTAMFSGTTGFQRPDISILLRGKNLMRGVQMDKKTEFV